MARLCPYIESCDLVVGETTCDRELWRTEIGRFKDEVERITGNVISAPKLKEAIGLVNARRAVLQSSDEWSRSHVVRAVARRSLHCSALQA